jgi:hypothetical protein
MSWPATRIAGDVDPSDEVTRLAEALTAFENKFLTRLCNHLQPLSSRAPPVDTDPPCYRETGVGSTPAGKITPR